MESCGWPAKERRGGREGGKQSADADAGTAAATSDHGFSFALVSRWVAKERSSDASFSALLG
jgi:hypothetical protein